MSGAYKFMKHLKTFVKGGTLLSAATVTAVAAKTGMEKRKSVNTEKDKVVFISKEENAIPPKVKIIVNRDIIEDRGPVLPNGEINLACDCIERDVVGPCNLEFRKLRVYMHENHVEDLASLTKEVTDNLDRMFEDYVLCTMEHPVYYKDNMIEEEIEDLQREKEKQEKLKKEKQLAREANTRNFGKDTVVFLTKEEASSKCTVTIPKVVVEEDRGPLNPDGSINWGCTCIERDVIGPCNLEFRQFRQFAESTRGREIERFTEEEMLCVSKFLQCIKSNPVYYKAFLDRNSVDSDMDNDLDIDTETPAEKK